MNEIFVLTSSSFVCGKNMIAENHIASINLSHDELKFSGFNTFYGVNHNKERS